MADETKMIKILIKTPQVKETIEINEKAKIQELKNLVSEKFNTELDRLCLIFAGKILKDHETLEQHKITDGLTIHLVIRPKKKQESQSSNNENPSTNSSTTTASSTSTNTTTTSTNANPFGSFIGAGPGDIGGFGRDILNNPELTQQLFNNPLIQDLMSNPDNIRAMLSMNPQMQQLIERNPEINHLLNNNEILRNSMEMIRNPSAFQELMRQQDRALSNLESLPGGYNALRRMYTELQEPMLNAASEHLTGENPFASFARQNNNNTGSTNVQAGTENRDPLPNPWSRDSSTTTSANTGSTNTSSQGTGNILNNSNLFSQLMENRDYMNSMLNSPQAQQMMQSLLSNPESLQRMMANNPLLNSDSNLQQQMNNLLPNAFQQLQTSEMRQALSNPECIEAMLQITRGMEQLQRVAPGLFNSMMRGGGGNLNFPFSATSTAGNTSTAASTTTSTATTTTSSTNQPTPNLNSISQLNNLMAQMFAGGPNNSNANQVSQPPEERYRQQLEQLNSMGFTDRQQNLSALIETLGDVNGAIERLLNRGSYFS